MTDIISDPQNGGMHGLKTSERGNHISLTTTALQRALILDALRVFHRRVNYAYDMERITRVYPAPYMKGTILEVPRDPDTVKMFLICVAICNLKYPNAGRTQSAEGLATRLNREALASGLVQEEI